MPDKALEGWTVNTLKEYILAVLDERDKLYTAQAKAIERALDKAEGSMSVRLEAMNGLREDMRDQAANYSRRADLDAVREIIDTRLKILENKNSNLEGRLWAIGAVIVVINILVGVISFASHYVVK